MVILARMTSVRVGCVFLSLALMTAAPGSVTAQQTNSDRCRNALMARGFDENRISPDDPCFTFALSIVSSLTASAWLEDRDVQSSGSGNAAPAGTPAQSSAVPTVQPTSLAATMIAAVAQDSGATLITAISINPAMLMSSATDPAAIARLSRVLDLTVFFPVHGLDQNSDGRLDYGGVRGRVNLTAGSQARALLRNVERRLTAIVQSELRFGNQVHEVLLAAPDPAECAAQLTAADPDHGAIRAACGADVGLRIDAAPYAALREAAAAAREEADARYIGLDLRFDAGDPSLGKVRNAAATALQGGLGFGRRFNPTAVGATAGLRGRLGVRYVSMRDTTLSDWQVDGGVALELARVIESQRLELSAGFEFRHSGDQDAAEILRTRYAEFRASIHVPIEGSTGIALSLSAPLMGEVSPTLSISGNWQQLVAGLATGR